VTKPNPENCKNCSSKCAYDCAQLQYTIQHLPGRLSSSPMLLCINTISDSVSRLQQYYDVLTNGPWKMGGGTLTVSSHVNCSSSRPGQYSCRRRFGEHGRQRPERGGGVVERYRPTAVAVLSHDQRQPPIDSTLMPCSDGECHCQPGCMKPTIERAQPILSV